MFSLALFTRNTASAQVLEDIVRETDDVRLVLSLDSSASMHEGVRVLGIQEPEVVLIDVGDWEYLAPLYDAALRAGRRARWIGFGRLWTQHEEIAFAKRGISPLLREPFGPRDLDRAVFTAYHAGLPEARPGLWAFLPAKGGAGCSTAVLNTAGALRQISPQDVLLIEADGRSGSFAMLMNLSKTRPVTQALERVSEMTALEWRNYYAELRGVHILPADPSRPGRLPTWTDYYQLLRFLEDRYRRIFADLPEVVNDATAELVRGAEHVFVVSTQEIPALKLAEIRCRELLDRGVPRERIQLIVTRFQRSEVSTKDIEKNLGWPVYTTLANDFKAIRNAILEARMVAPESFFGRDCRMLAKMLTSPPGVAVPMGRLERLSRLIAS
jgi:MinD-like ATPase involved in chromosome partitioning or flagellar assembly